MKKIIIASLLIAPLVLVHTAFGASSDYLLQLGGVDGESTKAPTVTEPALNKVAPPPTPPRPAPSPAGDPDFDLLKVSPPPAPPHPTPTPAGDPDFDLLKKAPSPSPASPMLMEVGTATGGPTKGKVEAGWKVEEGEKMTTQSGKVNVAAGDVNGDGRAGVAGDGRDDLVFSEPTAAQSIYMKLGDIKGEKEGKVVPTDAAGKEIRKNITINLRAKELRGADEKTKNDILLHAPTSTDAVHNGDDLALFVLRDAVEDPAIDSVDIDGDKMVIQHEAQGKFLGLFKMAYPERVEVDAEGAVHVQLPWYSFFVNEDIDEEDIALAAKEKKKEKPYQIESWSFGASQAGMYMSISNILKTKHDTAKNSVGNVR